MDEGVVVEGIGIRPFDEGDREWLRELISRAWGLPVVSVSGPHDPAVYPGFVAVSADGGRLGAATYLVRGDQCELVTINSIRQGHGIGRALLTAVRDAARAAGCRRLWLITTNDNLRAIAFYQRAGMDLAALHRDFVFVVRAQKPAAGSATEEGAIPMRHALEFELVLP